MATRVVTSHEMQKQLPELLLLISKGDGIIIKKDNKPSAKLTAISKFGKKRIAGLNKGEIWTSEDFDKPLSLETGNMLEKREFEPTTGGE